MQVTKWVGVSVLMVLFSQTGIAQQLKLGRNPSVVEKSAVLELNSTNQGLLFSRIADTTLVNALTPPDGMVIYFTPSKQLMLRSNGAWQALTPAAALNNYWSVDGNTNGSVKKIGNVDNYALPFITNNTERMRITNTGRVGIGNTAPNEVLDITGNFRLSGAFMPGGNSGTLGHVLISNGPGAAPMWVSPNSAGSSFWTHDGNAVSSVKTLGTTTNYALPFITNNVERMRIANTGNVGIGTSTFDASNAEKLLVDAGNTSSFNVISGKGTINNYLQLNIQNRSNGTTASSDIVATADNGNENVNFVDLGINSSGYTNTAYPVIGGINNAYLYSTGNDFSIGNATSGKNLSFFTGGTALANERMRIDGTGKVGIGNTAPAEMLDVTGNLRFSGALMPGGVAGTAGQLLTSNGAGAAPTWMTPAYLTSVDTTNIANFSVKVRSLFSGVGPISYANGQVSIAQASASTNGYLSSTDWNTFNNKLSSVDTTNIANFSTKVRGLFSAGSGISYNAATGAISATGGANNWAYGGNTVTTERTLGTADNFALPFITNNTEKMRITNTGRVGIGTNAPNNILEVTGTNAATGVSGLRLTNLGTATIGTANSKVLSVNSNGDVIVTNNPATSNWLITGNTGINSGTNFLGNIDDKAMIFKSNNASFLEFGRRQTLGLTQGYTDYDNNDEKVTYVRSALQFEATGADFYKPKMYTDANGNFRVKGSSAGTDYFEFGSTGTANNGGFEFVIGDDGDEPILFKSYHYINGMSEIMRLQSGRMAVGSNAFDATNPEKLLIDAGNTNSYNLMTGKGSIDNYLQINVQNRSAGTSASSDLVATSNNGSETTNFIDMGINGGGYNNNASPILNGANRAYLYSTGNDLVIGNGSSGRNLSFFTGGLNTTNERMRIDGTGRVGIGNTAPSEVLDVTGNMKFSGALMPGGSAGTAGYLLSSNGAGATPSWISAAALAGTSSWTLGGNSVSSLQSLGTTTNYDLSLITNNTEQMRITADGNIGIGSSDFDADAPEKVLIDAGSTDSYNLIYAKGERNGYLQFNVQNISPLGQASTDIVATADNGTETANYVNLGINGGGYNNASNILSGANNGYLFSNGKNFLIGNTSSTNHMIFFTGGIATGNERMRITNTGNVGIGTTNPSFPLSVEKSSGTVASFNRTANDGTIISLRQDGVEEGSITVSGTTISYNAFTGSHYASTSQPIEKGMLVTLTGKNQYLNNNKNSEIIYGVQPSAHANDSKIMGSYLGLQESSLPYSTSNPNLVMAVGNGVMWVADKGENLAAGDYLISSDVPGHAMKENGGYATAYVIARVAESVNWTEETAVINGVKHKLVSVFFESFVKNNAEKELETLKQEMKDMKERILQLEKLATQR